jgi:hypothetical protein
LLILYLLKALGVLLISLTYGYLSQEEKPLKKITGLEFVSIDPDSIHLRKPKYKERQKITIAPKHG